MCSPFDARGSYLSPGRGRGAIAPGRSRGNGDVHPPLPCREWHFSAPVLEAPAAADCEATPAPPGSGGRRLLRRPAGHLLHFCPVSTSSLKAILRTGAG